MESWDESDGSAGRKRAKERAGFAALAFEQFQGGLQRYLLRRLRNSENAQDLAQEVYLRLLRFGDRKLVQRPAAYVYRVAFNVLCEFKLHEEKNVVAFDSEAVDLLTGEVAAEGLPPEEILEQRSREHRLDALLEELPTMQRAVFLLAVRHDVPHEEIARRLDLSLHTVRKYLYRTLHYARQKLSGE